MPLLLKLPLLPRRTRGTPRGVLQEQDPIPLPSLRAVVRAEGHRPFHIVPEETFDELDHGLDIMPPAPLTLLHDREDVAAKIEPAAVIDFLSRAGAGTAEEISRIIIHHPHHRLQRAYKDAARAGALAAMIAHGFGGSARRIYTKEMPELLGCIVRVEGKRRVVTGDRYAGCGPGYWGDEAEGPALENQQHHTLISFDPYTRYGNTGLSFAMAVAYTDKPYEIEQRFVEKTVLSPEETDEYSA